MRAMVLENIGPVTDGSTPLVLADCADPTPGAGEVLIRVSVCGVCHTELDEIEGRMRPPMLPVIPGHQVVGRVESSGVGAGAFAPGDRVGVAWIYSACERCELCKSGNENLCAQFRATGRDANGGYAELMTVPQAAPLLCAGAIGFRSLRLAGIVNGQLLGLTGFGASAHLVLKLIRYQFPRTRVFVFARSERERAFARELGAAWAGDTSEPSPERLSAIIDTTPAWTPVVAALANLQPRGRLVINAIRKEDTDKKALLGLDYPRDLWLEKEIKSVANVTRFDVREFLRLAAEMALEPEVQEYPLDDANRALCDLKLKDVRGAKVLRVNTGQQSWTK
jgi:propanol-preferring alcohol dehydrogenase